MGMGPSLSEMQGVGVAMFKLTRGSREILKISKLSNEFNLAYFSINIYMHKNSFQLWFTGKLMCT